MANEISTFKNEVKALINPTQQKVWLTEKQGKRVQYLFKVGQEQFTPPQKLAQNNKYVLFGQKVTSEADRLGDLFEQYLGRGNADGNQST